MNGVTAGIGSGLLRNLFWKNIELNIVCADFVTNGSLAIASHTVNEYRRTIFEPKIYHINRVSDEALFFGKCCPFGLGIECLNDRHAFIVAMECQSVCGSFFFGFLFILCECSSM